MTELPKINVDFSNQGEDDLVFARAARATQPLKAEDVVLAIDREGNECAGYVARLEDGMVYLALNWNTWVDGDSPTRTRSEIAGWREVPGHSEANGGAVTKSRSAPPLLV